MTRWPLIRTWPSESDIMTRYIDEASGQFPYAAMTYIEATFPDGTRVSGSGTMVGRNDVLTAAHVVYDPRLGGAAESVQIEPGRDAFNRPFGSFNGARIDYFELASKTAGRLTQSESERDFALVGLDEAVGDTTGWFSLGAYDAAQDYRVTGYPSDYRDDSGPRMMEDTLSPRLDSFFDTLWLDGADISPGSSGGPLWYADDNIPTLVGAVSTDSWATAVEAQYNTLQRWIAGNDGLIADSPAPLGPSNTGLATLWDTFANALNEQGWSIPADLQSTLETTQPLLTYPALDNVIDPVMRLYIGMLGRAPDQQGAEYWVSQLNAGQSPKALAEGFVNAQEFDTQAEQWGGGDAGRIEALYQNVLGRSSDAEGRAYWLEQRQEGVDMADIALSFTQSDEFKADSESLVQGAKLLLWGVNLEQLNPAEVGFDTQAFADELRLAESIVRLYTGILDRDPDIEGFSYWLEQADSIEALDALAESFTGSDEFLADTPDPADDAVIDALYQRVHGRAPDTEGARFWQAKLADDTMDVADLALALTESDEYQQASQPRVDDYLLEHYDGGLVGVPADLETYLMG